MDPKLTEVSHSRDEIAGCGEKEYDYLSINDAKQMLMISSDQELSKFITEVDYIFLFADLEHGHIHFSCYHFELCLQLGIRRNVLKPLPRYLVLCKKPEKSGKNNPKSLGEAEAINLEFAEEFSQNLQQSLRNVFVVKIQRPHPP
ncbi:hypothetical protein FRX31_032208 [Thalictrum thalictroides]|uniref:Uncharacterized protein n=1 Tax=Thalictrum thalictroides TaxID=46969 RepID=A0A7J6V000_THATH|nr:hypothetical protein FRX31_032208 [Thalictrum thalictroides]